MAISYRSQDSPVFLCGITANDKDELWDVFTQIFALVVTDKEVLKQRILSRTEDGFGKSPNELANLMSWQQDFAADYSNRGATIIDASLPLGRVVDSIIARL